MSSGGLRLVQSWGGGIDNKYVCLVGNKMDLLPVDSKNCDARIKDYLLGVSVGFSPGVGEGLSNMYVCLVGNKMDLLPVDSKNCDARIKAHLLRVSVGFSSGWGALVPNMYAEHGDHRDDGIYKH